jgi:choline-sulfatase
VQRREFIKLAGMGLASTLLPPRAAFAGGVPSAHRPNILVICGDQFHPAKLGYRGHPHVRTPNLDRLAAEGAHFTRAYCNSPICGPSRMSFLTGKYIHQLGVWLNGSSLDPGETTWGDRFSSAGIATSAYGKVGLVGGRENAGFVDLKTRSRHPSYTPWPFDSPFDQRLAGYRQRAAWLDRDPISREAVIQKLVAQGKLRNAEGLHFERPHVTGYFDEDREVTNQTLAFLRQQGKSASSEPWLHFAGYTQPHWPYVVPKKYLTLYDPDEIDLSGDAHFPNPALHPAVREFQSTRPFEMNEARLRKIIAAYYGMISCLDDMIGELLAELRQQGLYDNTYVIFTADHGGSLGEHGLFDKQTSYEASVGIPLAIRGPGIAAGQRIDSPVSLVDLYPTLLAMGGLEGEADRPGTSWLEPLMGGRGFSERPVFSEYHGGYFRHSWYMLTRDNLKYTYYTDERPSLFDLREDPHEKADLAADPGYRTVLSEFEKSLRAIVNPEQVALRAKRDLGLIGPTGDDYTQTLSWAELKQGRKEGKFRPRFRRVEPNEDS